MASACDEVRRTCGEVTRACAARVRVSERAVDAFVDALREADVNRLRAGCGAFDADGWHGDGERNESTRDDATLAMFTMCVDAINFCFWPDHDVEGKGKLEYEHLTRGLRAAGERDPGVFTTARLRNLTGEELRAMISWPRPLPGEDERARLLREIGEGLETHFHGSVVELIRAAEGSAAKLVDLVVRYFPGFRDTSVYRGRQVFFYKRAQIFVGDLWGTFRGGGLGEFADIAKLTMFADYRVPVTLREFGMLEYADEVRNAIVSKQEIPSNSEVEIEIRAATVVAVEAIRRRFEERHSTPVSSVVIDWLLWEMGEAKRENSHEPHHRTRTIFY